MREFSRSLTTAHGELTACRHDLATWMRSLPGLDGSTVIADVELVLTELVANVIDHTDSTDVVVLAALDRDGLWLSVMNDSSVDGVPDPSEWGVLQEGHRGRGLRLVRALCSSIEVAGGDDRTEICVRIAE